MKKIKIFSCIVLLLMVSLTVLADDVLITRDGSMMEVKIEKITTTTVTFVDLKHKNRGHLNAPTDFIYMIMKEKGNNMFFDESGNQMTVPVVKLDKGEDVLFLNNGKYFSVYNLAVSLDELTYQMKKGKGTPRYKSAKDEVFMVRNADGTTTLYNNSYQERVKQQRQAENSEASVPAPSLPVASLPAASLPAANVAATAVSATAAQGMSLLASGTESTAFFPAPQMAPADLEMAVNAKNPFTLYRKGSMAEYCFQYKGKKTQYMGGPTYVRQIVTDEKIENGLLVSYIKQVCLNKKGEPSKGLPAAFKESLFPVEIDTAGTFHFTHNVLQDFMIIAKRRGYALLIPGDLHAGMQLQSATIYDNVKNLIGGTLKFETRYTNWSAVAEEKISTPAGTFDCVKLTGHLAQRQKSNASFVGEQITCWIARGIGIVQYESIADSSKNKEPFVMYLNRVELK